METVVFAGVPLCKASGNLCLFSQARLLVKVFLPSALESLCHWRWMLLALKLLPLVLKLEFQCQKKPALEFAIGVETSAIGVETAAIGVETDSIGVEICVESCYRR